VKAAVASDYRFSHLSGKIAQGQEAIIPIFLATLDPRRFICVGTAFFISPHGLLATAAHVLEAAVGRKRGDEAGLAALQYWHPDQWVMREVTAGSIHSAADVGIFTLGRPMFGMSLPPGGNKIVAIANALPKAGDSIRTWAYPLVEVTNKDVGQRIRLEANIVPTIYEGQVVEEMPNGRPGILKGPCYHTTLGIEGGASGGPVFDSEGRVFALNSTSYSGTDITFVSHIQSIFELPIEGYTGKGGEVFPRITVSELIKRGEIAALQ
jgi:hypothetical protein